MTTHVFVVDIETFPLHLEYLFAGTGAKNHVIDFNSNSESSLHHTTENMLVEMIADASRIRKGDFILFYLQQNFQKKVYEGKFFGIFRAKEGFSFLDNNDSGQFLKNDLGKSLTFRTLIEPFKVYPQGVTEWQALDEIKHLASPNQMLWSLIYRKLKGNRGNTMITIYESERLCQLIRNQNNRQTLSTNNSGLSFDLNAQRIVLNEDFQSYSGRKHNINILPRLVEKFKSNKTFENHLQAYITKNIGKGTNRNLDNLLIDDLTIEWLGNEVYCGVGMRKMDMLLSLIEDDNRILTPVELKSVRAKPENLEQLQKYIEWLEQYYLPNRPSDIQPILIAKEFRNKNRKKFQELKECFCRFNGNNGESCKPLKYIEVKLENEDLVFEQVNY